MTNTAELLSPADLAEALGLTEQRVMDLRRHYRWPHVRLGRTIRFTPEQVEQIIASHSRESEASPVDLSGRTARSTSNRRRSA